MCGICGFAYSDLDRPIENGRLERMLRVISHRGPDGRGTRGERGAALGHHRLSIIDLEGGDQPLANEEESVWIVFNGEIYNFRELRSVLRKKGHRFKTLSDTEVLVHAYEEYGLDFVRHLNGMFALALHDLRRRQLILARDHLGIKPLFYSVTEDALLFASEVKSILAGSDRPATVSPQGLQEYLIFRYTAWSRTFFDGIRRLPPGHLAVWKGGKLDVKRYWRLPDADRVDRSRIADVEQVLDAHLDRAVSMQMVSDVPLGTFCSGGVDSGVVTRYAARHADSKLQTFSVGFEQPEWDESPLAHDTSRRLGTDHHLITLRSEDFVSGFARLIWYNDEPLSHPNSIPLYYLSGLAREKVKVILTGEGADELFGGYPRYHISRVCAGLDGWPAGIRRGLSRLAGLAPGHRAERLSHQLEYPFADAVVFNSAYVGPDLVSRLTGAPIDDAVEERRQLAADALVPGDGVRSMCRYELLTYVVCALDRIDRMAMATGLETRVPFLDVPLVEWGIGLSSSLKLAGTENKRVLKRLAARWLNPRIVKGAKSGFGLPLADWFRTDALSGVVSQLRDPRHPAAVHFDGATVQRLVDEHLSGAFDHGEVLWLLGNVYAWHTIDHVGHEPTESTPAASGSGTSNVAFGS